MQKPEGYDQAQAMGDFVPIDLGGHYAKIIKVEETQSEKGKDMIIVGYDFCDPDKQAGYFQRAYSNDDRDDKKWPYAGRKYIMVNDYQDPKKTSRSFKTFCTCVEKSNGMEIKWGVNNWGAQFAGKKVGVVFGEEESEYDGKVTMRRLPRYFCKTESVSEVSIPNPKYLDGNAGPRQQAPVQQTDDGFMNIPEGADEEIPF